MKPTLKDIAWNRIRLKIPSRWEIARIGTHQLVFQDDTRPTLELKWSTIKGRFSHQAHFKQLAARYRKVLRQRMEQHSLAAEWERALSGFAASGFSWRSDNDQGRGVILFCPECRTASLIQFFSAAWQQTSHLPAEVLKTFQDHRGDGLTDWTVFDIHAILPESLLLKEHQFRPGSYALRFSDGKQTIHLFRWAPASALLKQQRLAEFAERLRPGDGGTFTPRTVNGSPAVEWEAAPGTRPKGWLQRRSARPPFEVGRIWHLVEENRILAVKMESRAAVDTRLLDRICESYGSL